MLYIYNIFPNFAVHLKISRPARRLLSRGNALLRDFFCLIITENGKNVTYLLFFSWKYLVGCNKCVTFALSIWQKSSLKLWGTMNWLDACAVRDARLTGTGHGMTSGTAPSRATRRQCRVMEARRSHLGLWNLLRKSCSGFKPESSFVPKIDHGTVMFWALFVENMKNN